MLGLRLAHRIAEKRYARHKFPANIQDLPKVFGVVDLNYAVLGEYSI